MAETIKFRGAQIMNFDVRQAPNGTSTFVRVHMRADFSDPVREAMNWAERPEGWAGGDLIGSLTGVEMMLKPSSRELAKYAFKMPIRQVKDFRLAVKGKEDKEEIELVFTVESNAKRAYVTLGNWIENLGKEKGMLMVSYSEQATLGDADVSAPEHQGDFEDVEG